MARHPARRRGVRAALAEQVAGREGHSSIAARDGRCYTLLRRNGRETVVCLRTDNGHEEWHYDYEVSFSVPQGGGGPRSTPALDGDRLYTVGVTGQLNCLD